MDQVTGGALGTAVLPITAGHGLGAEIWGDRDPGDGDRGYTAWGEHGTGCLGCSAGCLVWGTWHRVGCPGPSVHHRMPSKRCLVWDDRDKMPSVGCLASLWGAWNWDAQNGVPAWYGVSGVCREWGVPGLACPVRGGWFGVPGTGCLARAAWFGVPGGGCPEFGCLVWGACFGVFTEGGWFGVLGTGDLAQLWPSPGAHGCAGTHVLQGTAAVVRWGQLAAGRPVGTRRAAEIGRAHV